MIIKTLQFLRTRQRQVPIKLELDKFIGTYYNQNIKEKTSDIEYNIVSTVVNTLESGGKREVVRIEFNNQQKAQQVINFPDREFSYHDFVTKKPDIKTKYIYNYEFIDYETFTKTTNEMNLPSGLLWDYLKYYGPGYSLEYDIRNIGPEGFGIKSSQHHQVSARLGNEDNEVFDKRSQALGSEPKKYDNNYFKFYTDVATNHEVNFSPLWSTKQKNIFLMYDQPKDIDYLPYCVTFRINHEKEGFNSRHDIANILNTNELSKFLFLYIKRESPNKVEFFNTVEEKTFEYNTWDLLKWLRNENFSTLETLEDEIVLYDRTDPDLAGLRRYLPRRFRKVLVYAQIMQIARGSLLRFEDVIENKERCRSSVLGYKVEKYSGLGGNLLQTFYLEGSKNNFIDNQISYDKRYMYKVHELRIVIGGSYRYSTRRAVLNANRAVIRFTGHPSIQVVENHVYTFAYKVSTPPLYSPDVIVSNEEVIRNKVKFFVSDNTGNSVEHIQKIEKILETDEQFFTNLRQADFIDRKGLARFFARTNTGNFEVYRIEEKPESYSDFAPGFVGVFNNYEEFKVDQEKHATFIDYIEHEKTYYYMFRSLDHYGNPGKPSFVSEVYLIEDADEVILRYKSYDIYEKRENYDNTKSFRKYLQIVPAYKHVPFKQIDDDILSNTESTQPEQPVNCLGIQEDESLWDYNSLNSYIKLRVTSKKTGKKFDLNLRFKQIKN